MDELFGADHRHHAGADVGVPAGGLPAGPDRADVRAVRAGHRRDRAAQRHQRRDAEADAVRAVAAAGRCRRSSATSSIAASTRVYDRRRARLCAADRRAWSRTATVMVVLALVAHRRRRSTACRACRPASCRSRTRAICWRPCSCPTAPRSSAPSACSTRSARSPARRRASTQVITIAGVSRARQQRDAVANAGVAYIILKDWSVRGKGAGPAAAVHRAQRDARPASRRRRSCVMPPPPIQGIGNAAGFTMQVELRDGNFDFAKLQSVDGRRSSPMRRRRARMQRGQLVVPRRRCRSIDDRGRPRSRRRPCTSRSIRSSRRSAAYLGSTYVNQFNKFGRTFQVYVQADAQFRLTPSDIENLKVRNSKGRHDPARHAGEDHAVSRPVADQPLQSLSVRDHHRPAGARLPLRPGDGADGADRQQDAAAAASASNGRRCRTRRSWSATRSTRRSALALLLVYLVLAGQYESWYAPVSVILAVPLSLLGPVVVLTALQDRATTSTPRSASCC